MDLLGRVAIVTGAGKGLGKLGKGLGGEFKKLGGSSKDRDRKDRKN